MAAFSLFWKPGFYIKTTGSRILKYETTFFIESQNNLSWKGNCEGQLGQSTTQSKSNITFFRETSRVLNTTRDEESTILLGNLFPVFDWNKVCV